jgi:hypothetical protein
MTYINIDVDLDDMVEQLSSREKQKLVDALYDDGYYQTELEKELDSSGESTVSVNEQLFRTELSKISKNYVNLTNEDEELIMKIGKRF